ncbi:hypothetical protein NB706_001016 [Xanthomonas sacchari]|nr:hypothetical protein [Xanthomonas sacchari]
MRSALHRRVRRNPPGGPPGPCLRPTADRRAGVAGTGRRSTTSRVRGAAARADGRHPAGAAGSRTGSSADTSPGAGARPGSRPHPGSGVAPRPALPCTAARSLGCPAPRPVPDGRTPRPPAAPRRAETAESVPDRQGCGSARPVLPPAGAAAAGAAPGSPALPRARRGGCRRRRSPVQAAARRRCAREGAPDATAPHRRPRRWRKGQIPSSSPQSRMPRRPLRGCGARMAPAMVQRTGGRDDVRERGCMRSLVGCSRRGRVRPVLVCAAPFATERGGAFAVEYRSPCFLQATASLRSATPIGLQRQAGDA